MNIVYFIYRLLPAVRLHHEKMPSQLLTNLRCTPNRIPGMATFVG